MHCLPRSPTRLAALLLTLACLYSGPGLAAGGTWRIGHHDGFDRIVVPLAGAAAFTTHRQGEMLIVESAGLGALTAPPGSGQMAVLAAQGRLSVLVPPGITPTVWRLGERLVIDLPVVAQATKTSRPHPAPPAHKPASGRLAPPVSPHAPPQAGSERPSPPAAITPAEPKAPSAPVPVRATNLPPPEGPPSPPAASSLAPPTAKLAQGATTVALLAAEPGFPLGSILVPAPADTGSAAFRLAGAASVVFDKALSLDLAALKDDPVYGGTTSRPLAAGALLQLRLPTESSLRLLRRPEGWQIGVAGPGAGSDPDADAIDGRSRPDGVLFAARAPSSTLVLDDQQTGARLLVGTQRLAGGHVAAARRSPEFSISATWQGVVVETASDRLLLRSNKDGFLLCMAGGPVLATTWPVNQADGSDHGAAMTRRLDLPDLSVAMLGNRLRDARRDEAAAPRLGRKAPRRHVAEAMLALGMDREALTVLRMAEADDPGGGRPDPSADTLRAAASWLAGEAAGPSQSTQTASVHLPKNEGATDEDAFWQAIGPAGAAAQNGGEAARAAATLGATWSLALSYPAPIRDRLLPRLADILLETGQKAAAASLLAAAPARSLDLARAMQAEAGGHTDAALAGLDQVARDPDRDRSAKARREAVELRLATHRIDGTQAAAALQSQLYAWRGDDRERELRIRTAALLGAAGLWRQALGLLRETDKLYPQAHDRLHAAETGLVASLLTGDRAAKVPPLELVALVAECADLLDENPDASALAPVLVDKLLALDLPGRAEPILARMAQKATGDVPRAELGLRLAELLLAGGDASAAGAALEQSRKPELPTDLSNRRSLFEARMLASIGDSAGALRALEPVRTPDAVEQAAGLFERRHDWQQAADRLASLLPARIPESGTLDDKQSDLVLRYASDAAQAADMPALRRVHDSFGSRIASGARADLLHVLTQTPIDGVGDLPRAGQELASARALPDAMSSLRSP